MRTAMKRTAAVAGMVLAAAMLGASQASAAAPAQLDIVTGLLGGLLGGGGGA
ncbi:hypothetical protein [Streptomyces boninensis]|uniref:hypothetical protein n=1 Tax=Streptomyces boninensis TaxID=2039455 RepID=UPI003B2107C2